MSRPAFDRTTVLISVGITLAILGGGIGYGLYSDQLRKPFDVDEMLRQSIETAHAAAPDAKLFEITAERVSPDGKVHMEERGYLILRFRTESPTPATPAPMLGAVYQRHTGCSGGVVRTHLRAGARSSHFEHAWSAEDQKCLPLLVGLPKCTFKQIWERARAKGAPERAYADIDLAQEVGEGGSERRWRFEIVDRPELAPETTVFHAEFADDC